ncbi:hypothetical protein MVES_000104 [Malassezia vespertilionis]|uniref:Nodulin-like domain-containing protein n=1 Tax=Malassezia vespertilionis TaxID=2020962 RepID=A0A2N1JG65_9BASI|nr:hypothetical protein MVES_000104 [Malassezia vespertilionis]
MTRGRRIVSLAGSILISLSAGSTYVFSSYAPQLQSQLNLSSTQLNVLGLAGNLGMYVSGPIWGRRIDHVGPHGVILCGAAMVLLGYGMLAVAYRGAWVNCPIWVLALFMLMTGVGNSAGNNSAINVQAKSWGGSRRGSAMALVLSMFGLSALVYSTLSQAVFKENTAAYLLALSLGSFFSFLLGAFMVKIIPPGEDEDVETPSSDHLVNHQSQESEPLLGPSHRPCVRSRSSSEVSARVYAWLDEVDELGGSLYDPDANDLSDRQSAHKGDITGWDLFRDTDFLLLFTVLAIVSGAGLLMINNVGSMTQALWEYNKQRPGTGDTNTSNSKYGKHELLRVQALQVSLISAGNAIGVISDYFVRVTKEPSIRTYFLIPVTFLAFASQLFAAWPGLVLNIYQLLYVSSLTGLMYGTLFGLCPVLIFEWFGVRSFSQNWGLASLGPVIGGNIYNLLFGRVYDSNGFARE